MWPWSEQQDITALLSEEASVGEDSVSTTNNADPRAGGLLFLQAPGGGDGRESRRAGSYRVSAGFPVAGPLLEAAISRVEWLVVSFRQRRPGADSSYVLEPFPSWVLQLQNLRGLSLEFYPHTTLPEKFGDLTNLEHLHCYGSALVRIPRSFGRLRNLVELDLYTSYCLHYLPMEIHKCTELRDSRFSTRALYANYKNEMHLPPLKPWWGCSQPWHPVTPGDVCRAFSDRSLQCDETASQLLPLELISQHILPFLTWEYCSVCGVKYELELGYHTWSHQLIATDRQALLSFCCSARCASRVKDQMYFDPKSQTNKRLQASDIAQSFTLEEAVIAWSNGNGFQRSEQQYEKWSKGHLAARPSNASPPVDFVSFTKRERDHWETQVLRPPVQADRQDLRVMAVLASGDIRKHPCSSSANLGRLDPSTGEVLVDDIHVDERGREWARLYKYFPTDTQRTCWTAVTKKDGTVKLREMSRTGSCPAVQADLQELRVMVVLASGDIRKQPSSSSKKIGRIEPSYGEVLVDDIQVDKRGRQWARLYKYFPADDQRTCWTAVTKKDGTVKLREVGRTKSW